MFSQSNQLHENILLIYCITTLRLCQDDTKYFVNITIQFANICIVLSVLQRFSVVCANKSQEYIKIYGGFILKAVRIIVQEELKNAKTRRKHLQKKRW